MGRVFIFRLIGFFEFYLGKCRLIYVILNWEYFKIRVGIIIKLV